MLQGISSTYVGRKRRTSTKRSAIQRALQTRIGQIAKRVTVSYNFDIFGDRKINIYSITIY